MLGVIWPRVQNFKYFSLNHLIPWDLKPTQTPFPPEAGRNWNLEGWKITFPKTFLSHLCCHVRHLEKYRSVWGPGCDSAMLLGDLPLQGVTGWLAAAEGNTDTTSLNSLLQQHTCISSGAMSLGWKMALSYLVFPFLLLCVLFKQHKETDGLSLALHLTILPR